MSISIQQAEKLYEELNEAVREKNIGRMVSCFSPDINITMQIPEPIVEAMSEEYSIRRHEGMPDRVSMDAIDFGLMMADLWGSSATSDENDLSHTTIKCYADSATIINTNVLSVEEDGEALNFLITENYTAKCNRENLIFTDIYSTFEWVGEH